MLNNFQQKEKKEGERYRKKHEILQTYRICEATNKTYYIMSAISCQIFHNKSACGETNNNHNKNTIKIP